MCSARTTNCETLLLMSSNEHPVSPSHGKCLFCNRMSMPMLTSPLYLPGKSEHTDRKWDGDTLSCFMGPAVPLPAPVEKVALAQKKKRIRSKKPKPKPEDAAIDNIGGKEKATAPQAASNGAIPPIDSSVGGSRTVTVTAPTAARTQAIRTSKPATTVTRTRAKTTVKNVGTTETNSKPSPPSQRSQNQQQASRRRQQRAANGIGATNGMGPIPDSLT